MTDAKTQGKKKQPLVNIYFAPADRKLLEKFIMVAQKYNLTESKLGAMVIRNGLRETVKELDTQETKTNVHI
jgi:hypothetical protein